MGDTLAPPDLIAIPSQEGAFAVLLREAAAELVDAATRPNEFEWAITALRGLAQERCPEELAQERRPEDRKVRRASARVVFACKRKGSPTRYLRPGVFVPFEFRRKPVMWMSGRIDWVTPEELFDPHFIEAMNSLVEDGDVYFPMSAARAGLPPLPPGILSGDSGKFAVGMAQALANPEAGGGNAHAIPPWVAVTATARREGGDVAAPVGRFEQKMRALIQEGIRVVIPADAQGDVIVPGSADGFIEILPQDGRYARAAESLRAKGYAWPADLSEFGPTFNRRQIIIAFASFLPFATAIVAIDRKVRHVPDVRPTPTPATTPAMDRMRERRAELEDLLRDCLPVAEILAGDRPDDPPNPDLARLDSFPINSDLARLDALCRTACRRANLPVPLILPHGEKPRGADHAVAGVETIARHVAFDCSRWKPLHSEEDIQKRPKEAAFSTTVYRFRRKKEGPITIALEMNSGGFGVVPLLGPGDRLILGTKSMKEAAGVTKTSFVVREIPAGGPLDFEIVLHSIYFNGFQDQQVRRKDNWCSVRVPPGTLEASLALVKPEDRAIASIRRSERVEMEEPKDLGVPATLSGVPATLARAAGEKLPVQDWYVWSIDMDELSKSGSTVYSMRWKLMPSQ